MKAMATAWVGIEDDPEIESAIVDEELKALEEETSTMKTPEDDGAADDSEVDDDPMTEVGDGDRFKSHLEAEVAIQKLIDSVAELGVDPKEGSWSLGALPTGTLESQTCQAQKSNNNA